MQLSGLQHFLFCRRQWALIQIENQWQENLRTIDGKLLHERAHNDSLFEKRGDVVITRGMEVFSRVLGVSGKCDVLEFHKNENGVPLARWEGRWMPYPVEYKKGKPKADAFDEAQLCGQAMCLEEMLCVEIPVGALYYGEPHRRTAVTFDENLRRLVRDSLTEMHALLRRAHTPKVKPKKGCNACSLKELCLPVLTRTPPVHAYIAAHKEVLP